MAETRRRHKIHDSERGGGKARSIMEGRAPARCSDDRGARQNNKAECCHGAPAKQCAF